MYLCTTLTFALHIHHTHAHILTGPPGCGKTLIARQIGKILNAREPKIINGPEVLDKFVGGTYIVCHTYVIPYRYYDTTL